MGPGRFSRYQLRTTDVGAARLFYAELLGPQFWTDGLLVTPLPERAAAQGAPAHWLGQIGVGDVEGTVREAVALGAQPLGPTQVAAAGAATAVLRDPCGAVLAVSSDVDAPAPSPSPSPSPSPIAWRILHTPDPDRSSAFYARLFGEQPGTIVNIAGMAGVHPHWLFCFPVSDLERVASLVRDRGGKSLPSRRTSTGDLLAVCDDPQGAAFGLVQSPRG